MISTEKNEIKKDIDKIEQLEKLQDRYYSEYQQNQRVHDKYIDEMKKTINKKLDFDLQLSKSYFLTQLIYKKLKKATISGKALRTKSAEELQKRKTSNLTKSRGIESGTFP